MRDEKEGRSKHGDTNNKAKQHSTPKAVIYPKKKELPRVGHMYIRLVSDPDRFEGDWVRDCMYV